MGPKTKPSDERRDNSDHEREAAWAAGLKAKYDEIAQDPVPDRFRDLLERLEDAESRKC